MNRSLIAVFVLLLAFPAAAGGAAPGPQPGCMLPGIDDRCERWVETFDSPGGGAYGFDEATALAMAPSGNRVFVVGRTAAAFGPAGPHDSLIVAYDDAGAKLWDRRYDGPEGTNDEPSAAGVSTDGQTLFVAGVHNDGTNPGGWLNADFFTAAYETSTGSPRWITTYDGFELQGRDYGNNHVTDMALSPDGSEVYVTGYSLAGASSWDFATFAYDARTGEELWRARYASTAEDRPSEIVATESLVVVTGTSDPQGTSESDAVTVAYEAGGVDRGVQRWVHSYDGGSAKPDVPADMVLSPDGATAYVAVASAQPAVYQATATTLAYRLADGDLRWSAKYSGTNLVNEPASIRVSPSGDRIYVVGTTSAWSTNAGVASRDMDIATVAYDAAGTQKWAARYGFPGSSEERGAAVAIRPDGQRVYVTGYSSDVYYTGIQGFATIAYDASGAQKWVARHRPAGAVLDIDEPRAIEINPAGTRLFLAGTFMYRPDTRFSQIATQDMATVSYDACEPACPLEEGR